MVCGYLRVSTEGQEDGHGLDVQRQNIVAYAAVQSLAVDRWHSDVESGAKESRPGLQALRRDVATGEVAMVLVYRMDRLAREALLAEQLHRELSARCRVVSVTEALGDGFTGDLMRRILAAFSDYERAVIATRTTSGRRESVRKNGTYGGGGGVLGYRPVGTKGDPGRGELSIVESEAEAVRRVFELRAGGESMNAIAGALNAEGHRTVRGATFTKVQVHRVIGREAFYRGAGVLTRTVQADAPAHRPILPALGR